jgi:hypothetical protein
MNHNMQTPQAEFESQSGRTANDATRPPNIIVIGKATVYFDDPFWVGVFERQSNNGYSVARVVFGAEPSEAELYQFVLLHYRRIVYSEPLPDVPPPVKPKNFKRRLRESQQSIQEHGVGGKAHEAMRLELEKNKTERKQVSAAERTAEQEKQFLLRQEKHRQKKRGR